MKIGPSCEMDFVAQNAKDWVKRPQCYSGPREIKVTPAQDVEVTPAQDVKVTPVQE